MKFLRKIRWGGVRGGWGGGLGVNGVNFGIETGEEKLNGHILRGK